MSSAKCTHELVAFQVSLIVIFNVASHEAWEAISRLYIFLGLGLFFFFYNILDIVVVVIEPVYVPFPMII